MNARKGEKANSPIDQRLGSSLQAMLNDLKRDQATAAKELGLPAELIARALTGEMAAALAVRNAATRNWPVSSRNIHLQEDDVPRGVLVWKSERSKNSARVIIRSGNPYYEYRDTAMASVSPIRPEWIAMLVTSETCDPLSPNLKWNCGHALHQLTYFLGDVDFYYQLGQNRYGRRMRRGDSAFIPSWVPHTFSGVDGGLDSIILAVTFPGRMVGDAMEDFIVSGGAFGAEDLLGLSPSISLFGDILRLRLNEASQTLESIAAAVPIEPARLRQFLNGEGAPSVAEISTIATALALSPRDFAGLACERAEVIFARAEDTPFAPYPADRPGYRIRQLARSPLTPDSRGVEIEVKQDMHQAEFVQLRIGLHQYGYVNDRAPIKLAWGEELENEALLDPGDSFYMKPWTRHAFLASGNPENTPTLVSFRSVGAFDKGALLELAALGSAAMIRYKSGPTQWYG